MNLIEAYNHFLQYKPQPSLIPSYIDLTECPYFWPYCTQPLYFSSQPVIVNVTILNGVNVYSKLAKRVRAFNFLNFFSKLNVFKIIISFKKPVWRPSVKENGHYLNIVFEFSSEIWPWSGYIAIKITVDQEAREYDGYAEGEILITIETNSTTNELIQHELRLYLKAKLIGEPPRQQRILWDQYHNLRYPSGYFPRDDLKRKKNPLDWNGDHVSAF